MKGTQGNPFGMVKAFGMRILVCSALTMAMMSWGCAFHDLRNDYKSLVEKQMEQETARARAEKTAVNKLPDIKDVDHERLGDGYFRQGKLGRAFVQYEKALSLNPKNTRIHYKKGLLFLARGLNKEAITEFQLALKKDPRHARAYEGMGLAFFKSGLPEAAERNFRQALELDSSLWKAHTFLGIIYNHRNLPEAALQEHEAAIMLEPDRKILYNNLGISYALMGKYGEALRAFEKALKAGAANDKIYNNLGIVLSKLGRYEEALEAFRQAGSEAQAYNNLGCVYLHQGEHEKAIRSFEKAVELSPSLYTTANENLKKARNDLASEKSFDLNAQEVRPMRGRGSATNGWKEPVAGNTQFKQKLNLTHDMTELDTEGPVVIPTAKTKKNEGLPVNTLERGRYTVHLATFKEQTKANQYLDKLRKHGLEPFKWEIYLPETGRWYRACVGTFVSLNHARLLANDLEDRGFKPTVVELPGAWTGFQFN